MAYNVGKVDVMKTTNLMFEQIKKITLNHKTNNTINKMIY